MRSRRRKPPSLPETSSAIDGALEPDADLGALDAPAGLVGHAALHHAPRPIGGVAADDLATELLLGRQQAARHRPPRHRAFRREARAEIDAVALDPWGRRATRHGVRLDQRRRRTAPLAPDAPFGALDAADVARVDVGGRRVGRRRPAAIARQPAARRGRGDRGAASRHRDHELLATPRTV